METVTKTEFYKFFRNIVLTIYCWFKQQRLIELIILVLTLITAVSVFWGPSINIAKKDLSVNEKRIQDELDPLIQYEHATDRFKAISSPDVEIKDVSWFLLSGLNMAGSIPGPVKINLYSKDLIFDELRHMLVMSLVSEKSGNSNIVESFVDCYVLGSEYYRGIPLIIETEFRRRGSVESIKSVDLAYIKGSIRDGLYIKREKNGVGKDEVASFIATSKEDFDAYMNVLNDYNQVGDCGIEWGYPRPELF